MKQKSGYCIFKDMVKTRKTHYKCHNFVISSYIYNHLHEAKICALADIVICASTFLLQLYIILSGKNEKESLQIS